MKDKVLRKALAESGVIASADYPATAIEMKDYVESLLQPHRQAIENYNAILAICKYLKIDLKKVDEHYEVKAH